MAIALAFAAFGSGWVLINTGLAPWLLGLGVVSIALAAVLSSSRRQAAGTVSLVLAVLLLFPVVFNGAAWILNGFEGPVTTCGPVTPAAPARR